MIPELSDLQMELLLTPSTLDSKIPFLHYLPILQELLQLVQHLRQQCHAHVLTINPHIASPSHFFTPTTRLSVNSKIEKLLSLSMALAWRFCTFALVLLPQLPSYRASFHETVLRPFKREAAQYLARIQTYYKLGALKYLEADLSSTSRIPRQQTQPQTLLLKSDGTEDNTKKEILPPSSSDLVQAASWKPSQPVPNTTVDTSQISSRGTMAPTAVLQLQAQIDASKASADATSPTALSIVPKVAAAVPGHESIRAFQSVPQPASKTTEEHLDRTSHGRLIAAKERALLSLPLPNPPSLPSPPSPSAPLLHPPRRLAVQHAARHIPAVVITAPTPSISPLSTEVSTSPTRRPIRSTAHGSISSTTNTARLPMSPTRALNQRRVSVQSLIQRFEVSVPSAETYRMAAKYRDRRLSLPHLQRALENAEPSALTSRRSHPDAPSSPSSGLRLKAIAAASTRPTASATTSEAVVPYHLRDELSRKRSTREHIRSLPAYQLSRIEDRRSHLSITSSSSSSSSSYATIVGSSSSSSMHLDKGLGAIKSTDGGDMSSEEERRLSKLADTIDRCVAGIVGRVESALSLSRASRVSHVDRTSAVSSTCNPVDAINDSQPLAGPTAPRASESDALMVVRTSRIPTKTQEAPANYNRLVNNSNNALSLATQRYMPFNNPDGTTTRNPSQEHASSQGKVHSLISEINRRSISLTGTECSEPVVKAPSNSLKLLPGPASPATFPPLAESQLSRKISLCIPTTRDNRMTLSTSNQIHLPMHSGEGASIYQPRDSDDAGVSNGNRGDFDSSQSTRSSHVELIRVPTQSSTVSTWSSRFAPPAPPAPLCPSAPSTAVSPTSLTAYSIHSGNGNDGDSYNEGTLQYLELYSPTPRSERDSVHSGEQESTICTTQGSAWGLEASERRYAETDAAGMTASSSENSSEITTFTRSSSRHLGGVSDESRIARPLRWANSEGVPAFTKPFKSSPQPSSGVRSSWSSSSVASTRSTSSLRLALPSTVSQWNPRQLQNNHPS